MLFACADAFEAMKMPMIIVVPYGQDLLVARILVCELLCDFVADKLVVFYYCLVQLVVGLGASGVCGRYIW